MLQQPGAPFPYYNKTNCCFSWKQEKGAAEVRRIFPSSGLFCFPSLCLHPIHEATRRQQERMVFLGGLHSGCGDVLGKQYILFDVSFVDLI